MADIIVGGILLAVVVAAILFIRKEKKRGVKCIGCPDGGSCSRQGNCPSHSK